MLLGASGELKGISELDPISYLFWFEFSTFADGYHAQMTFISRIALTIDAKSMQ
jgi:hypothetical protein